MKFTICALVATSNAAEIDLKAKITAVEDTCKTSSDNVPCKGSDNNYYCVAKTEASGAAIITGVTVNTVYTVGTFTCANALDGELKVD